MAFIDAAARQSLVCAGEESAGISKNQPSVDSNLIESYEDWSDSLINELNRNKKEANEKFIGDLILVIFILAVLFILFIL